MKEGRGALGLPCPRRGERREREGEGEEGGRNAGRKGGKEKREEERGTGERDREKKKKADCREEEQQGVGRNERERTTREGWMRTVAGGDRGRRVEGGLGSSGALVVLPLRFGEPWGPTSQGDGGADLSRLPASFKAHCLPAALWLHLLTSACRNTGSCLQLAGCPQPACCPHPLAAHGSEVAAPAPACTGWQGRGELRAEQALQAGAGGGTGDCWGLK